MLDMDQYVAFYNRIRNVLPERAVRMLNEIITDGIFVSYPVFLFFLLMKQSHLLFKSVFVPGITFCLITLLRNVFDVPRPYEEYAIEPVLPHYKKGHSFPSRHVFSATVIAFTFMGFNVWFGTGYFIAAIMLAGLRVIGGVHYPKDVIVALLLGIFAGISELVL